MFSFSLTEEQKIKLDEWKSQQAEEDKVGTIGDRYTYSFTPTSLGIIVIIKDNVTNSEINLTDFSNW